MTRLKRLPEFRCAGQVFDSIAATPCIFVEVAQWHAAY